MSQQIPGVLKGFDDLTVVSFESRMAEVMEQSLTRHGARVIQAPALQEIPLDQNPEVFSFAERLFTDPPHLLICLTGVGTRLLIEILSTRYPREKIINALSRLTVVARGPKPVKVLKEFGIPISVTVPEPNTWREIIESLDTDKGGIDLKGKSVAIQEYGVSNEELISALKKRGASVIQIPVYRWSLPDDRRPLEKAIQEIIAGNVRFALFTTAVQVRHVIRVASELGLEKEFRNAMKQVVIASIGPDCTAAIRECGFAVDFEPSHSKMGHLIAETAKAAADLLEEKRGHTEKEF